MDKTNQNPILAGLLNMLVPGSVNVFIKKEWRKFFLTFIGMELVLAIVIWLGVSLQSARYFSLPQGLCPGAFALIVFVPLFLSGRNAAIEHNKHLSDKVLYQSRAQISSDDDNEQIRKIQKMRDEGLISEQQFEVKKGKIDSKE